MDRHQLFMGTSGLVLPYKNRQAYPAKFEGWSRLAVYGALTNSLEVNSIFYKLPKESTVKQWCSSVPDDFRFTFKLWKQITHSKGLAFDPADVTKFFGVIAGAEDKKGCILVQFPASVKPVLFKKVAWLLSGIGEANSSGWPVAVEFRSTAWYNEATYELLNEYGAAMVFHDKDRKSVV